MIQTEYETLVKGMADISGYRIEDITSKFRTRPFPALRWFIGDVLMVRGYSSSIVSKTMHINHATLLHGRKKIKEMPNNKNWRLEYSIYKIFKEYADKQESL